MKNVVLIPCGGANFSSVLFALGRIGINANVSLKEDEIAKATHVILPGVGSAGASMEIIKSNGLVNIIKSLKKPVLGICLGMQILFEHSAEDNAECLGVIKGKVVKFNPQKGTVPHMGWNGTEILRNNPLLKNIPNGTDFYYTHSYYAPNGTHTIASSYHGDIISSIVVKNNFYGTQFHPEKSGKHGLTILQNFINIR
jgi:glutamine amidotransferase